MKYLFSAHAHVDVFGIFSVTFSAFQCSANDITLSCPNGQDILVSRANYGYYGYTSTQDDLVCKMPYPSGDCVESIEAYFPVDWFALTELCNGKNNCTFPTQVGTMTSCSEDVVYADYTQVWFECLPGTYTCTVYIP